jgi:hypothetical protein
MLEFIGVQLNSLVGGVNASLPDLMAKARAGSEVTVQWSGIIQMRLGPTMTVRIPYHSGLLLLDLTQC